VDQLTIDLRKEQQATRARPRYPYSAVARVFVAGMDVLVGRETTLAKAKLIEILAPVPYREWERRAHERTSRHRETPELVRGAGAIEGWGQAARDNERRHLRLISEKLREDSAAEPWYLTPPIPSLMAASYGILEWTLARVAIRRAFLLNAELEDHAEHTYAQLVEEHPEWEEQPAEGAEAREYGSFRSWADVFRRIGLDERDHRNASFAFAGMPQHIVRYEGMPASPGAGASPS
jgi:ubiquinol oxidase